MGERWDEDGKIQEEKKMENDTKMVRRKEEDLDRLLERE